MVVQILLGVVSSSRAAETNEALALPKPVPPPTGNRSNRLTVAVLGFENRTGDAELDFWRVAIEHLVSSELKGVGEIRVAPGVDYARRQINKKEGEGLEPAEARKAGEIIEARRVVWGEYRRDGKKWQVTARVMNVATGNASKEFRAVSSDWFTLRDKLMEQILGELKARPTRKERRSLGKRWTKKPAAFEWLSKARFYDMKPNHEPDAEKSARRAIEADPQYSEAYGALAAILGTSGKLDEAEQAGRRSIELRPDSSSAHSILAHILGWEGSVEEANKELEKALELDPEDEGALERLGESYGVAGDWTKALEFFLKELAIDGYSASTYAHVGYAHAQLGERDKALAELRKAESLASPEGDVLAEQFLYNGYSTLREIPKAVEYGGKLLKSGKEQGVSPKFLAYFEKALPDLRARLAPTYIEAVAPIAFTEESLSEALRQKLSPEEMKNVINPLAITPQMKKWAHELTAGATNDFEKGRMLSDALSLHAKNGFGGRRTAQEVFAAWADKHSSFLCEEYTFLYLALAREMGLKCYCAQINQDCYGRKIQHVCAAIFLREKCLLADPSYYWFGVPHKAYRVLNDVELIAARMTETGNLSECQAAYKLAPDYDRVRFGLIWALVRSERWEEARKLLAEAPISNPLFRNEIQSMFAVHDGKLEQAFGILRGTIDEYPDDGELRVLLANLYWRQEKLADARTEYRNALPNLYTEGTVERVYFALAQINEKLGQSADQDAPKGYTGFRGQGDFELSKGEYDKAIGNYSEAIRLNPEDAGSLFGRAYAHAYKHEFRETIEDCTKALAIESRKVEAYDLRAWACWKEGELTKALGDLEKAIDLAPSDATAYETRGKMYWTRQDYAKAAKDYREVARLRPTDADSQSSYAWMVVCTKDSSIENSTAAMQAAKTACELSSWTNAAHIEILAAACDMAGDYQRAVEYEKKAMNLGGLKEEERESMFKTLSRYDDSFMRKGSTNEAPKSGN